MGEIVTKEFAEALMGGIDAQRREVERARDEIRHAEARHAAAEAKLAGSMAMIARALEGIPMSNLDQSKAAPVSRKEGEP